jgi:cyclase
MTEVEKILWKELRNNKLGYKFRRQHPISNFIIDFYCHEAKLAIELDGSIPLALR